MQPLQRGGPHVELILLAHLEDLPQGALHAIPGPIGPAIDLRRRQIIDAI